MITARGWWFLVLVFSLLTLGAFDEHGWTLTVVALTLLLWSLWEWLLFALRVRLAVPPLHCQRELSDERGPVETLWAGRSFRVRIQCRLDHWLSLPQVSLADYLPLGVMRTSGSEASLAALNAGQTVTLDYGIRCPAAGRVRFEGVMVQLADFQGFFYHETLLPSVAVYRVLPSLADAEGHRPTIKRHNLLPSPGLHRHLRPGSGSELLDLRDYLPGDPPKTIAWKVSARRDRLITKEFESEVPVRCTLFVDTSHSVRVGPPGQNALARLVDISAAVAQATAGVRDLTGLCLFDEKQAASYLRPARGSHHLIRLLHLLTEAAGLAPATGAARLATLLPTAHAFAQEVYPDLLRREVNRVPGWLPWFWPIPTFSRQRPSLIRQVVRGLFVGLAFAPLVVVGLLCFLLSDLLFLLAAPLLGVPDLVLATLAVCVVAITAVGYYGLVNWAYRFLSLFLSSRRRIQARWRKQLAALLSEKYGLAPGGLGTLLEDDEAFVSCLQRFLAEHQVPYPLPLYDRRGRYLFASPGKVGVLAKALLRAVGRGHDNELFVLLVDLLELPHQLGPLVRAVKVTLARHHQVLLICPWPPGVPPPSVAKPTASIPWVSRQADLQTAMHQATTERLHGAYHRLRRSFARMGVPLVCAASGDPVRLILDRLQRLRALGRGGRR
jgi:uncharacterized protein (DUF58 family)